MCILEKFNLFEKRNQYVTPKIIKRYWLIPIRGASPYFYWKKERIEDIEKHIDDGNLVEYIFNKYRDEFFVLFDNEVYDNEALNLYFQNYSGYIQGNESRKYGIMNETDGLLLIPALISDKIEHSSVDWTN